MLFEKSRNRKAENVKCRGAKTNMYGTLGVLRGTADQAQDEDQSQVQCRFGIKLFWGGEGGGEEVGLLRGGRWQRQTVELMI